MDMKKFLRRMSRRLRAGWRIYKESTVGKIGLGIMMVFVITAIFAPFIAPYSPNYTAPSEDVFKADFVEEALPKTNQSGGITWQPPVGYYGDSESLETILVYSLDGQAVRYHVEKVGKEERAVGMSLKDMETARIPSNTTFLKPVYFRQHLYLLVSEDKIYEVRYSTFTIARETELGFKPKYYSNLWNRWSLINTEGRLYFAVANETKIALYARVPPNQMIGEFADKAFLSVVDLNNVTETEGQSVIGDVLVMERPDMNNGSLIIAPLSESLVAFKLEVNVSYGSVKNVKIGPIVWQTYYDQIEAGPERNPYPIMGRPVSFYKEDPSETLGKDRIVFASEDGYLYAFYTENGTLAWSTTIKSSVIREPIFSGVYATYRGVAMVVGISEDRGFIASIDPLTGLVEGNGSAVYTFDGKMTSAPQYVPSSRLYIFSTDWGSGVIYILRETLSLYATFTVSGGVGTPVSYIGNIINQVGSYQGNYFAVVTKDARLHAQSMTGTYVAPLKPGVYPSGNRYILGTDVFGHDIFSQMIYATRIELAVGIISALLAVGVGTTVGLISGYYGGWIDSLLMRITDIFLTLPVLVIILLMAAILGGSIVNIIFIIALFSWSGIARVIRAQTLSLKTRSFIDAARVSGATNSKIILIHLAPNVLPFTFLYMTFTISGAIITEAILAFLGFGDPTVITWGMMLQYLRISGNTLTAPWWLLPPGIGITLLSLSFYLIGRALDEVVNPRLRSR